MNKGKRERKRKSWCCPFLKEHHRCFWKVPRPLSFIFMLTLSNPIFLPTAYSPALICFGRERGWWITSNYPTVSKEKNREKQEEYNLRYLLAEFRTT
jgi:hypothetical protein